MAEPDAFLLLSFGIILYEVKLTEKVEADLEMTGLYVPLLQHLYPGLPISRVLIFRHRTTKDTPRVISGPFEPLALRPLREVLHSLHWLS